ncbi:MAG TPA: neutral/alkaline non-lysosomal ceramidase N-terminal domain-containing protein [Vicinamibacteria bacterium]|nr:neutral/alkaline non-lysosomal ceramidase N-terminal domain-containing protein [Vicinamibacteria bacterium]
MERTNWNVALALAVSLFSGAHGLAADTALLRAGAARVDVTPAGDPAYPASGRYAHERLYVRAIVLDNGSARAALIGADLGGLGDDVVTPALQQVSAELGCPPENVIVSATHSHSAVPSGPPAVGFPRQPAAPTVAAILDAVRQAKARLQPAVAGFGTGFSYLNVNRDVVSEETHLWTQAANLSGPSDKTVAVLQFTTSDGRLIAAYVNYAMHPVNGYLVGITSADVPGAMCRYVEQQFAGEPVVVFSQGASGDQNPLYLRPSTNALASLGGTRITGFELVREAIEAPLREGRVARQPLEAKVADTLERWIESEGQLLGEEVIRVMTHTPRRTAAVRLWGARKTLTCPARRRTNTGREGSAGTYEDSDEPVRIRLGVLGVGDTALASVDAEIYSGIGQRARKESPLADTVLVTLANGRANSGYVPDDASFGAYTFQVLGSRLKPGCAEQGIADGIADLVGQYLASR